MEMTKMYEAISEQKNVIMKCLDSDQCDINALNEQLEILQAMQEKYRIFVFEGFLLHFLMTFFLIFLTGTGTLNWNLNRHVICGWREFGISGRRPRRLNMKLNFLCWLNKKSKSDCFK